jgi:hypothetical protein
MQYPILAAEEDDENEDNDESGSSFDEQSFELSFPQVDSDRDGVDLGNVRSWVDDDEGSDGDD